MNFRTLLLAGAIVGLCAAADANAAAPAQIVPLEFQVTGDAAQPSVTALAKGGFVVTWQQRSAEQASLWFAELDKDGRERRRGRIAEGRNWFVNWADFPSLVVLQNGDWVTFWLQQSADLPHAYDIQVVRSSNRGRSWSKPIGPHTDGTQTEHGFVSLLPDGGDKVLLVWLDGRRAAEVATAQGEHDHSEEIAPMTLRAASMDRAGRLSGEALLDDSTCSCCQTDMVRWAGRVLVAYRDRSPEEIRDIAAVARGVDNAWSKPRLLHADGWKIAGCPVNGPALAVNGERLLALWPTLVGERMVQRYQIRQWDQPATTLELNTGERVRGRVDAARWQDGFLLTWLGGQNEDAGPRVGFVGPDGQLQGVQPVASTSGSRAIGFARIASAGDRALVAWTSPGAEGTQTIRLALIR